jgi:hypothetical protein
MLEFAAISEIDFGIQIFNFQIVSARQNRGSVTQKTAGMKGQMRNPWGYKSNLHFARILHGAMKSFEHWGIPEPSVSTPI